MKLDCYASHSHYWDHLAPIWDAVAPAWRGDVWSRSTRQPWGRPIRNPLPADRIWLVAGWQDAKRLRPHPVIYVEHGAGQTYRDLTAGLSAHYSGGEHYGVDVRGYICPSTTVAGRWVDRDVPAVAVGCPRLDRWLSSPSTPHQDTIAVAWHWECRILPETRSAWRHYKPRIGACVERWATQGFRVVLHAHPRAQDQIEHDLARVGLTLERNVDAVMDAALLIADNTSLMYEFAALDRPVIALNAPWYRRDVHHGLRFWDMVPGLQVQDPDDLAEVDVARYITSDPYRDVRRSIVADVYASLDGHAAERAAGFIHQIVGGADAGTHVQFQ